MFVLVKFNMLSLIYNNFNLMEENLMLKITYIQLQK